MEVLLARSFYANIIFLLSHVKLEVYVVAGKKKIKLFAQVILRPDSTGKMDRIC